MSLNITKTSCMLIKKKNISPPNLYINNVLINKAKFAKVLGKVLRESTYVHLDKNLTFRECVNL